MTRRRTSHPKKMHVIEQEADYDVLRDVSESKVRRKQRP